MTDRVFRDGSGDLWFEVVPGRVVCDTEWGGEEFEYFPSGVGSVEDLPLLFGPITEVTHKYPRY